MPDPTPESDLSWLLSDPRGRRIIYRLLLSCGVFNACRDPAHLPFHEGRRSVATEFLGSIVRAEGAALTLLLTENQAEQPQRDRRGRTDSPSTKRKRARAVKQHGPQWLADEPAADVESADGDGTDAGEAGRTDS